MAIIRAVDHNKKMSQLEITDEQLATFKEQAKEGGFSVEEAILIEMTDNKTSRFKGTIYIEE